MLKIGEDGKLALVKAEDFVGCLFGSHLGFENNSAAVVGMACDLGFDCDAIEPGDDDGWMDLLFDAEQYLNSVAPDGYSFGWLDGDFFFQTDEWWDEAY